MMNTQNEFTMEVSVEKTAKGESVIYVDAKDRAGKTYTFPSRAQAYDALNDWTQIAQVIIPATGEWRYVQGFQTELAKRRDRASLQQKLAKRLAGIRAGIKLESRQRYDKLKGVDKERFNQEFQFTCQLSADRLKGLLKNEDPTQSAAATEAKERSDAKAIMRLEARKKNRAERLAKAQKNVQIQQAAAIRGTLKGQLEEIMETAYDDQPEANSVSAPETVADEELVPAVCVN
jgi:hypothetical protein